MSKYVDLYMKEVIEISKAIDKNKIDKMINVISEVAINKGRIFL